MNALTDHVMDEYLKNEEEQAALEGLTDEQRQIHEERVKVNKFISGTLPKSRMDNSVNESVRELGEEMVADKINDILKEVSRQNKTEEKKF